MAFQVPKFNVWCRVIRKAVTPAHTYNLVGYSRCQVRGPASNPGTGQNAMPFEVLFPKHSDVRGITNLLNGSLDYIQVAGWGPRTVQVFSVSDKGAGFTNEYRLCLVVWTLRSTTVFGNEEDGVGSINVESEPPPGYTPLPLIEPYVGWAPLKQDPPNLTPIVPGYP